MANIRNYKPNKLLAIELLSSNPDMNLQQVASRCDVTDRTINNWLKDPNFVDTVYTRYMEVAGIE